MIVFQSQLAGIAEPPALNQRSTTGISSPGGEDLGKGELIYRGRQSALISVFISFHPLVAPKPGRRRMVKKQKITKRTQIENHKVLPIYWMRKNGLASFSKTNPFSIGPWSFKAFQRLSKGFKAFQRFW
jgi:hypothetical protein